MGAQKKTPFTLISGRAFPLLLCVVLQAESTKQAAKNIATKGAKNIATKKQKKQKNRK